jgi:hypothetical protein
MALQQPVQQQNQGQDEEMNQLRMAMLAAQMGGGQDPTAIPPALSTPTPQVQGDPSQVGGQQPPVPATPSAIQTHQPDVNLAHASFADQPAAADVAKAQAQLQHFQHPALWKQLLVPALTGLATAAGAHTWGGRQLADNGQKAMQDYLQQMQGTRQSLVSRLQYAQGQQQSQYEADQRNRQQDIMLAGNNQARTLMAQIAAQSRLGVADRNAQGREDVANTQVQGREQVAAGQNQAREQVANTGASSRIQAAKINAQAALNRFLAGQQQENTRQQAGFAHTDNKPTADEDRRADLSEAMMGYADMLADIATRRPELFGPLAGRITGLRNTIGTDDPDVADLKFLREQLGITQMGAHSLRSVQAIAPIADALANSFHNDAATIIATTEMAKKGVGQFLVPQRPVVQGSSGPVQPPANPLAPRVKTPTQPPRPSGVPAGYVFGPSKTYPGRNTWQPPQQ